MKLPGPLKGLAEFWSNYLELLRTSFSRMSPDDQELLVTKASVIVTIGVTVLALGLFYSLIPQLIRIFVIPAACVGSWWVGGNVVAPVIMQRMNLK